MQSVFYDEREMGLVKAGLDAIRPVLEGQDNWAKERLLLCLDRFLDPWFGDRLEYEREIYRILEREVCRKNPLETKQDILHLLEGYSTYPLEYLPQHLDQIEPELLPDIKRLLAED